MRTVKYTNQFKRDYRREKSGRHSRKLDVLLMDVVNMLAVGTPLPRRNFDHALTGNWNDHRDCHIRPDPVLIYRTPDDIALNLFVSARIASLDHNLALERQSAGEQALRR